MKTQVSNVYPLFPHTNSDKNPPLVSFEAIIRRWLADDLGAIKPSTRAAYTTIAERHIIPSLGQVAPRELTAQVVADFIQAKSSQLAPSTARSIASVLCSVLRFAGDETAAVPEDVPRPGLRQKEARVLSEAEQQRLEQTLMSELDCTKLGVLLCLYTGLRLGELCALRWHSIDPRDGTVDVTETVQRIRVPNGTQLLFDAPKSSSSMRRVPLAPWLRDLLEPFRAADECFLLTGRADHFMEPRTMQNRFKGYLQQAGIRNINFHALRHTFATNCVGQGFDPKTLSCILGHSSVNTTLNTYVHPPLSVMRSCMARLSPVSGRIYAQT